MNSKILIFTFCVAVVSSLSGCALTTEQIALNYNQQAGVAKIAGADNVSVNVEVADQRPDKSKVSCKKNGYGMEMAAITATEDVALTIRKAIEQELQSRGFKLNSDSALVKIAADLARFYNDHKIGFFSGDAIADLNMSVIVKSKNGDQLYSKQIVAQGVEPYTQLATGNNAKLALDRALENGMKILFEDQAFLSALLASSGSKSASL